MSQSIIFIGAGNLATRLSVELKKSGFNIKQVYSRTNKSAKELADKLQSDYTTSPKEISDGADIYFVALKDSAFEEVLPRINFQNKLVVHCSGSMPLSAIEKHSQKTGVFYPLQTFSKERTVNFKEIPVFIEANSPENERTLLQIGREISEKVLVLNSEKRIYLHIAAVFVCNFVNHFYTIGEEVLKMKTLPFELLRPLILETALKVQNIHPVNAQTGPAVRMDNNVISKHRELLKESPEFSSLYEEITQSIYKYHQKK